MKIIQYPCLSIKKNNIKPLLDEDAFLFKELKLSKLGLEGWEGDIWVEKREKMYFFFIETITLLFLKGYIFNSINIRDFQL